MGIKNIIIHEVKKEGKEKAIVTPRESENAVDEHAETLNSQLTGLFKKTGLSTGGFTEPENDDDPLPHFLVLLDRYFSGSGEFSDFVAFTQAAANEFKEKLNSSSSSKGGYLWFNHYTHQAKNFLTVVLLRNKTGLSLSDDYALSDIEELDLDKLHMAARINLSDWRGGVTSKYIAFKVGSTAKDVTDYFSRFIGCQEYTKATTDTKNLVRATEAYCKAHELSSEQTESVKNFVHEQCVSWLNEDQPVKLDSLSSLLDEKFQVEVADVGKFLEIAQSEPYLLNNELPIVKRALSGLKRYSGKNNKMYVTFDSNLLNKSVFYDSAKNELTITDHLPADLVKQIVSG